MTSTFKKTILVDMDGVLADYSKGWQGLENIGDPIPGARKFLERLRKFAKVTIFTTRCHVSKGRTDDYTLDQMKDFVVDWLYKHNMPYDEVYVGQGKPYCVAIVDDRAVPCNPQMLHGVADPHSFEDAYMGVAELLGIHL